ncbi:MAG: ferritin-like domain-containing protein [Armatimonadetes bacterium]|nr:ferritin-like domain-containing protein [Armatimonadota bacterium]
MSKVATMHELYTMSLRDLYSAETQLVKALPKVASAAKCPELKTALQEHLKQTEVHVSRLEGIFKMLGESPNGHPCAAMKGLILETEELLADIENPELLDVALIAAAQKVEHYEIAGYGTCRTFARLVGHDDQARLLQETLDEEARADQALTVLAEFMINARVAQQPVGAAV